MRATTVLFLLGGVLACRGTGRPAPIALGPKPQLPPIRADWCIASNQRVDSAFAAERALEVLQDTLLPLKPISVRPVGQQSLLDGYLIFEGFLVTLSPTRLVLGGGGLVWVDGETGCPLILKRYE